MRTSGLAMIAGLLGLLGWSQLAEWPEVNKMFAPSAEPHPVAAPHAAEKWVEVATFRGNGQQSTDDFQVGEKWKLSWNVEPTFPAVIFQVYVHDSASGEMVDLAANQQVAGSATSIVRGGGKRHLKVIAANCRWSVKVEDWR